MRSVEPSAEDAGDIDPAVSATGERAPRGVEDSSEQAVTAATATTRPSTLDSRPRDVIRNEVSMPPNV
jgi:hypothetical protein